MESSERKLCRLGNPILREKARALSESEIKSSWFDDLLCDMEQSMKALGGIGIAAPQIGEGVQVAIIDVGESNRYQQGPQQSERFIIVNPSFEVLREDVQSYWEGCLSIPGLRGLVERPFFIRVNYTDKRAMQKSIEVEGFLATVFQHEIDHLHGTLLSTD